MKGEKIEDEKEFFNFYFKDTAESLHLPIECFYLPNSKLRKIQCPEREFHTVKKSYIKLLCCSPQFREDLIDFLYNNFVQEY